MITVKLKGTKLEPKRAAALVRAASAFDCEIYLSARGARVNAKSIMGVISLGISDGDEITLEVGDKKAVSAISEFFNKT